MGCRMWGHVGSSERKQYRIRKSLEQRCTDGCNGRRQSLAAFPDYQANLRIPLSTVRAKFAGRGVPDIFGCADPKTGYRIFVDGTDSVVGGTSAVAPLWAGLTALLNEQLGYRVGFLNPLLYGTLKEHKALNDVSTGSNGDYSATAGWTPARAWGRRTGKPFWTP